MDEQKRLLDLLNKKSLSIVTAESCTGGLISKLLTDIPGSSKVFNGSVVAYSNDIKINILKIPESVLLKHGAVSQETAELMAKNVAELFNANCSIATTGIAGPQGGSKEKPVGTICFAFYINKELFTETVFFEGNREHIRNKTALYAINRFVSLLKASSI